MLVNATPRPREALVNARPDVLVVGSGAAGLSAAITARLSGLSVVVAEKESVIGGSTARSGGNLWIPCNHLAVAEGIRDSSSKALDYIRAEAGAFFDEPRALEFLRNAPLMVKTFHDSTSALQFVRTDVVGDNHPHLPGAAEVGRTVTVPAFNGRLLGPYLDVLARPLPELTFLGMQIQPGRELNHFFDALKNRASFTFVVNRMRRHLIDLIRFGRTTLLANGNALAARLLKSALELDAEVRTNMNALALVLDQGRVVGAQVQYQGEVIRIEARRGVVLACGGYPHDAERRRSLSPVGALGAGAYSLAPRGNVGDGLRLGEAAGGKVEDRLPNTISWTPVSCPPSRTQTPRLFPHGFDRNRPGVIAVTRHGRRFTNEAAVGNDFIRAMARECQGEPVEGFLVTDHRTIRRYGLGVARPAPAPLGSLVRSGYLLRDRTVAGLARRAGIDPARLETQIAQFNRAVREGKNPEFQRGETVLERRSGDATLKPNPCLAPIERSPFYAVKIYPGDFSTLAGLRCDAHARVLDALGAPIPGLYAAGNDSLSMFGGNSIAGSFTLGPAMTFGFIAGRHIASEAIIEPSRASAA